MSTPQDGSGYGIFGQRYDNVGTRVGNEFQANTYTHANQSYPAAAGLSDGGFVVVWQSERHTNIYGQRYDSAGVSVGEEFRVNRQAKSYQTLPAVAGLSGGGFVVVWENPSLWGNVYGQRFAP